MRSSASARLMVVSSFLFVMLFSCKPRHETGLLESATASAMWVQPWEVSSNKGEMYLTDIFYADPSQNDQVMPTKFNLTDTTSKVCTSACYGIDHLIYPTLGNPNLFEKGDDSDLLLTVLRLEPELYEHALQVSAEKVDPYAVGAAPSATEGNAIKFFLVNRAGRKSIASASPLGKVDGVFEIVPTDWRIRDKVGLADLDLRRTILVQFANANLASVPAGLYDLRMEVLKNGKLLTQTNGGFPGYEYQFNAIRVFPQDVDKNNYSVVNVTDSQVSVSSLTQRIAGKSFKSVTHDRLMDFVNYINKQVREDGEAEIKEAAFISFNGDLHNGGSPASLAPSVVAWTYVNESRAIINILKELTLPIFLTAGNHDGYVSTGQVPDASRKFRTDGTLEEVIRAANPSIWNKLASFLTQSSEFLGGFHNDIFAGHYITRGSKTFPKALVDENLLTLTDSEKKDGVMFSSMAEVWKPVKQPNMILYDGFYQWRRTYGPLFFSWTFGSNHYLSLNTFDLRQHRRTGWGMYTVNYGGGMSQFQMDWMYKEMQSHKGEDVIIMAHHDPRSGHNGKDYPYMFHQIDFKGMEESAKNYIQGEEINPRLCSVLPTWIRRDLDLNGGCLHDGLQEWMMADTEFDCSRAEYSEETGKCKHYQQDAATWRPNYSSFQMVDRLSNNQNLRTLVLGHTHFNSLEIAQSGDALIPKVIVLDKETLARIAAVEAGDPIRAHAKNIRILGSVFDRLKDLTETMGITSSDDQTRILNLSMQGHTFQNRLQGDNRELVILRMTSIADLTSQQYLVKSMKGVQKFTGMGFAVFKVTSGSEDGGRKDYALPQLNEVIYYVSDGSHRFDRRLYIDIPRTKRLAADSPSNPLVGHFAMK